MKSNIVLLAIVLAFGSVAMAQTRHIILSEDFEGLELGESPEEAAGTPDVWTDTPPPGWFVDESGVPGIGNPATDGVTDWAGWAFTDKDWWVGIAGDQRRSEFTLGQGTVAVADPDEWDDSATPGNIAADPYDTWLSTNAIDLSTSKAGTAQLRFDSSWRPEFDGNYHQTANLTVSYDGGDPIELFLWESDSTSGNFKDDDSTNESIFLEIDTPPGAQSMVLTFGLFEAGNDWWWAIDNIVVTAVRRAEVAFAPSPGHGAEDVAAKAVLSWTPGAYVGGSSPQHRVILSDNLAAVEDGSAVVATQDASSFDATGLLDFSTTYYWRIDEANSTRGWDVGNIWEFSVEPIAVAISNANITATASSSFGVSTAERTIDESGLVDDLHGVAASDMWISGGIPATIEYAFDRSYRLYELWIWNSNQLIESFVGFGAKDVVIEYSVDGENWTVLDGVGPLAQASGGEGYAHNNTIDFGGATAQHVRLTVNSVQGIAPQASLSEVRFFFIPTFATRPDPAPGATDVVPDTLLSWGKNGREAVSHEVYVGADASDLALVGATSESSFDTLALDLQVGQTYSWRVDEVNEAADPSTWEGTVWSFTTVDAISIDDMESYADAEFLEIWATWIDGFDDPGNGSLVGNGAAGTPETNIVHGGSQSLPLHFDNSAVAISEATRTFDSVMDWTKHGVQTLVLSFSRRAENTGNGRFYVKVNDTKVVYPEDPAGLPPGWDQWTQWSIDLSTLGADLTRVGSLTIGIEGAGAQGVMYVDDIQLEEDAAQSGSLTWFEAESGTITAPMQVFSDATASAGQHIGTADGIGDENDNPPADGRATYSFTVPEDGVYRLAIRVSITGGSNSFWFRIPGMATNTTNHASGWVRFNDIEDGGPWHWDEVQSSDDGNQVVEFTLTAGTHTLEIARREDGALLDAIAVTQ